MASAQHAAVCKPKHTCQQKGDQKLHRAPGDFSVQVLGFRQGGIINHAHGSHEHTQNQHMSVGAKGHHMGDVKGKYRRKAEYIPGYKIRSNGCRHGGKEKLR